MKNPTYTLAWTMLVLALTVIQSLAQSAYEPYTFTTLAGNSGYGIADGTGSAARFWDPAGLAVDRAGNAYVADTWNNTIRKVTPAGIVTTLAGLAGSFGSADGAGSAARFWSPNGVAVDSADNVYVADGGNHTIRKITPEGVVTTLAGLAGSVGGTDGMGSGALFLIPMGVAVDSAANVYVADWGNHTIRKVTPAGVVTTLAGMAFRSGSSDGLGRAALFLDPTGVAVDNAGNVYVADSGNRTIRKVMPTGVVTTLAGQPGDSGSRDGAGSDARFGIPRGVAMDSTGNVYVADGGNHTIRKVTPAGVVATLAGMAPVIDRNGNLVAGGSGSVDGTGSAARFCNPSGVAVDSTGNVYVADTWNSTIRKVTPAGAVTTLAGLAGGSDSVDGAGSAARFNYPNGVAVDSTGNVYVADTLNSTVRKVTPAGEVTTLADGTGSAARFYGPAGVAVDSADNVYVADKYNNVIRKVTPAGGVKTLAGLELNPGSVDGTGSAARFSSPSGVAVDAAGNVYVAESDYNTIRKVTPVGVVTTLAGLANVIGGSANGTGSIARFYCPQGVAVDNAGNVYVADSCNHTIRKVTPAGVVTTLAGLAGSSGSADGRGSATRFNQPSGVAVDSAGNVYVADSSNATIRKVTPAGGVTTLAGLAEFVPKKFPVGGSADGTGSAVRFYNPLGVAVDSAGNVYVADTRNHTIRRGFPAPGILTSGPGFGVNGGQFGFFLTGPAGKSVVVEGSTDLMSWLPLWTNTFAGAPNFVDSRSGVYSNRFYRAFMP